MNIEDRVNKMSMDLDKLIQKASIWQSLFDECPIAVAVFTSDMTFYLINDAFEDLTGFSKVQVNGQRIQKVLPNKFRRVHKKHEKDFAMSPQKKVNRHGLEPFILCSDGTEIAVDIDLSYIIYDGKIYYVSFIRRIS